METRRPTGDASAEERKARHRDRMRRWVQAQKDRGRCRCGAPIAEGERQPVPGVPRAAATCGAAQARDHDGRAAAAGPADDRESRGATAGV